jgi:cytochrome b6-f complex iron-sulfur subunit
MEIEKQSRSQFLKTLGLSSKALMAIYCLGAVSACSKDEDKVDPNTNNTGNTATGITGTTSGTTIDFTIDLKSTNYSKLTTNGEFAVIGDVIVANTGGTYVALSKSCTHQGTAVVYRKDQKDFYCSNHGSEFGVDGSVEKSPATSALKVYKTNLDAAASTLKVS